MTIGRDVHPPAIELEVASRRRTLGRRCGYVSAVGSNDGIAEILYPDAAHETAGVLFANGRHVEHQTTHFTQKLAPDEFETVGFPIEIVQIREGHLREAARLERHGLILRSRPEREPDVTLQSGVGPLDQRHVLDDRSRFGSVRGNSGL